MSFTKSLPNCAASDGWAVQYRLVGPLGVATDPLVDEVVDAVADGAGWTITFTADATGDVISDGSYRLVGRASNAATSEATTVYDATCRILANALEASPSDLLTHAERCLTLIEAAIEKRLPADMEHYQIDGKVIGKIQMLDLMKLRTKYRVEVYRARNPGRAGPQRLVRFGNAR